MRNNKGHIEMIVLCFLLCISAIANAQTRYWVGGSGNWTDVQHWSSISGGKGGASLPSASTNAVINDKSGLSDGSNITLTGDVEVGSLLWNQATTAGFSGNYTIKVNDILNFKSSSGWTGTFDLASSEQSIASFSNATQNYNVNFLEASSYRLGSSLSTKGKVDVRTKNLIYDGYTINANPFKKVRSLLKTTQTNNGITIDYDIVDVKCYGTPTGKIEVNSVDGTTGTITYTWKDVDNNVIVGKTSNILSDVEAGTYYLLIRDEKKKSALFPIPIGSPTPFSFFEATSVDATCNEGHSGYITVSFIGGTSPYYYSIDGGVNFSEESSPDVNLDIKNLGKGSYNIVIKDANGCERPFDSNPVNVGEAADYKISATQTPVSGCFGNENGVIDVNIITAELLTDFECSIDGGDFSTNTHFSDLASGSHTIDVRRVVDHSCSKTMNVSVTEPTQLSANVTSTPVSGCSATPDGKIIITSPKGGSGDYEYSVDGGTNWQDSSPFGGLVAGKYMVLIRDKNSPTCTEILNPELVVDEEPALTASVSHLDATCNGSLTGSITLSSPQGGSGAYEYSAVLQGNADNWSSNMSFPNLAAGTYVVKIRDKNRTTCEKQLSLETLIEPNDFSAKASATGANCFGENGTIAITNVTGGGTYEYSIDNGATWGTATTITVPGGTYPVMMRIAGNAACFKTLETVSVAVPAKMTLAYTKVADVKCAGGNNGKITLSAPAGGTAPYTYSVSTGADSWKPIDDASFSALLAGTYTVKMKDSKGCIQTMAPTVNIIEPATMSAKVTASNVTCFGDPSGSLEVSAPTGGTTPYMYKLLQAGATLIDWQNPTTFASLPAGTYTVMMKDINGCEKSLGDYTITQKTSMSATVEVKNLTCFGDLSGTITISNPLPADGDFQYSIDNATWQTSPLFKDLEAKTYTVYINNVAVTPNCVKNLGDYQVKQPASSLSIDDIAVVDPACHGGTDGSITITATGGTAPLTYSIGGEFKPSTKFEGLNADLYTITVKDSKGCVKLSDITVSEPDKIIISVDKTEIGCGATTGSININSVTNGTAPYQYSIGGAAGVFSALDPIPAQISVPSGTYSVVVKDNNGCLSDVSTYSIAEATPLDVKIAGQSNVLCFGQSNGTIDLNIISGKAPYTYNIGAGDVALTGSKISGLAAGTYTVTIKDASNCTLNLGSVDILQPTTALSATATGAFTGCPGDLGGKITIVAQGGTGAYAYSVDNGVNYNTANPVSGLAEGIYTGILVKDANGCTAAAGSANVTAPDAIVINNFVIPTPDCNGGKVSLTIPASGGVAPLSYAVDNDVYVSGSAFDVLAGSHTLKVKDANGCIATKPIDIIEPAAIAVNATGVDVSCNGENTGKIRVTPTGGTAPYAVTLNPASVFISGEFANLAAGTYDVTVTDHNGCSQSQPGVVIASPDAITVSGPTRTQPTCLHGGTVTVTATGGTAPLTYKLKQGTSVIATQIDNGTFSNVNAGTFNVAVTDANGCAEVNSASVTLLSSSMIRFKDMNVISNMCSGDANGSLSATVINFRGTPSFKLVKDGVDVAFNTVKDGSDYKISATGLLSGTYTLTAIDDVDPDCAQSQDFVITEPSALAFTTPVVTSPGVGADGSIAISVAAGSGTAPYEYTLQPAGTINASGIFTGLAVGNYTVTVVDGNNCSLTSAEISLSNLEAALTAEDIKCKGGATGKITVDIQGGQAPYTIKATGASGVPAEFTTADLQYVITDLLAGDYSVLVTDANGNSVSKTTTIGEPAFALALGIANATDGLCGSAATGVIELAVNGGTNPYTITWTGDKSGDPSTVGTLVGQTISDLTADHYTMTVTDINGCLAQAEHTIAGSGEITIVVDPVSPACGTTNTGSITITATGGDGNYTYSLDGVTFAASNKIENLTDGDYQVVAQDGLGCTSATQDVTLTIATQINVVSVDKVDAQCAQGGQISVVVAGGSGNLKFELIKTGSGIKETKDNGIFNDVPVGTYKVRISDVGGTCPPTTTDPIAINNAGGTSDLSYENIESNPGKCFGEKSSVKFDLLHVNGAINVQVIDKATGNVLVQGTDYNIDIQPGVDATTFTIVATDFLAGNYKMFVSDDGACPVSVQFGFEVIATPLAFDSITLVNPASSASANGTITAVATGGVPPYQYTLLQKNEDGSTATIDENNDGLFTGLNPGTYIVTVEDAYHCVVSSTEQVLSPLSNISIEDVYVTDPKCNNGADGKLEVIIAGGSGVVSYSIDGGATFQDNPVFENISAGEYKIVVKDEVGATAETTVTVNNPSTVVLDIVKITTPSKDGKTKGSIQVVATGGTGFYNYVITNETTGVQVANVIAGSTTINFNSLPIGQYTVKATDENGCEAVIGPIDFQELALDLKATDASCTNGDATLNVTIKGGLAPYTLTLTDPEGNAVGEPVNVTEKTYTFENLQGYSDNSKKYTVTVVDATNSTESQKIHIDSPDGITLNVEEKSNKLCFGNTNGYIKINVSGGNPDPVSGYQVNWTNGGDVVGAYDNASSTITGLPAGNYVVTVSDASGCKSPEQTVAIEEHQDVVYTIDKGDASCGAGGSSANGYIEISGLEADLTLSLTKDDATPLTSVDGNPYRFENLSVGNYVMTIKRDGDCPVERVENIRIENSLKYNFEFVTDPDAKKLCYGATDGQIKVNITFGDVPFQRVELYKEGETAALRVSEESDDPANTEVWEQTFSDLAAGNYQVMVVDANGCTDVASVTIEQNPKIVVEKDDVASNLLMWCKTDPSDVKISLNATGGVAPYVFAMKDSDAESIEGDHAEFVKMPFGPFTISVFDAEGCSIDTVFTVTANTAELEYDSINAACRNFTDPANAKLYGGKIKITGVTGDYDAAAAYSFTPLTDGLSLRHDPDIIDLESGKSYGVVINDEIFGLIGGGNRMLLSVKDDALGRSCVIDTITVTPGVIKENDFTISAYPKDTVVCSNTTIDFGVKIDKRESTASTYFISWDENAPVVVSQDAIVDMVPEATGVSFADKLTSQSPILSHLVKVTIDGIGTVGGTPINNLCYEVDTATAKAYPSMMTFNTMPASVPIHMVDSSGYFIRVPRGIETGVILSFNPEIESPIITWSPEDAEWFNPIPFIGESNDTLYTSAIQINDKFLSQETIRAVMTYDIEHGTCTDSLGLILMPMSSINPPNAFTPNGDGFNDVWRVVYGEEATDYPMLEVEIFNRWGTRVYSAKPYKNNWDGRRKGKDLPTGTYYYVIKPHRGNLPNISGSVSIIR